MYNRLENMCYSCNNSYSGLNHLISNMTSYYMADTADNIERRLDNLSHNDFSGNDSYKGTDYSNDYSQKVTQTYSFSTDNFLNLFRTQSIFVGDASQVKEFVEEAFEKMMGRKFPENIVIRILDKEEMKKAHSNFGEWSPGIQGFSLNKEVSEIFVRQESLDKVMLTLGHELGHVLSRTLPDKKDEEAKAFAFSMEWMKVIKENNIGNLSTAIVLDNPANNGLHDVAFRFVFNLVRKGKRALDVFFGLSNNEMSVGNGI